MDRIMGGNSEKSAAECDAEQNFQIIHVPNTLRAKVGGGERLDPKLVKAAQDAIDDLSDDFRTRAQAELEQVHQLVGSANAADDPAPYLKQIFGIVHDLKGQGSTFGYTLLTSIGDNLCRFMHRSGEMKREQLTIVIPHVDALRAVVRLDVKGSDDPIGKEIVASLHKLSKRME